MKKKLLSTVLAVAMIVSLTACGSGSDSTEKSDVSSGENVGSVEAESSEKAEEDVTYDKITIRVGNIYNESTTHGQALNLFRDEIEEKSGGAITVDMYHGGTLGSEQDHIQAQKEGSVELIFSGTAGIGLYVPDTAVFECFYAFEDIDQIIEAVESLYDDLDGACQAQGFKLLGCFFDGPRQILSNKKIESIEDLNGLKLRAPGSNIYVNSITALGAQAISMPLGDVYTSLQTGAIDAMEGTMDTITQQKFYEQGTYLILDSHVFQPLFVTYNLDAWDKLSEDTQNLILECVADAEALQIELHDGVLEEEYQMCKDANIEFVELADRDKWVEAVADTSAAYAAENGELGQKIYDEIVALQNK